MEPAYHIPALLPETINALNIRPDGTYVDVTLGGAGHTRALLAELSPKGRVVAFDQDIDAIRRAPQDARLTLVHGNFRYLTNYLRYEGVDSVDGILADLGVSFHHFDDASRGFSFRADGPLDMRMNRASALTAADVVNQYDAERLTSLLRLYGEVAQPQRVARALIAARPVDTTAALLAAVEPLVSPARRKKELAQVFQALRIEVNDEMGALRALLTQSLEALRPGGRLAVITYHSLEDRLVKNFLRSGNLEGIRHQDFFGRSLTPLRPIGTKPIVASEAEVEANPRSRSAKLRVAEKTDENTTCNG